MKKSIYAILALIITVFSLNAFAQSGSGDEKINDILSKMEIADKKINNLEVNYTNEIFYLATNETQKIEGNLKYKKPDDIFIVQRSPQEQNIYINGNKITTYIPENSQAIIDNWKNVLNADLPIASIVNFSSQWKDIKKENIINFISEDADIYIIEISPLNSKDWTMQMHISKSNMYPKKAIVNGEGFTININLTNYKINQKFQKDLFKFTAPEGTEIIKI